MRSLFTASFEQNARITVESTHTGLSLFLPPAAANDYAESNYEPFSVEILQRLIKNCNYFVDIGAGYGYYSLVAQQQKPQIRVLAFESVPEKITLLKQNLQASKAKRTIISKLEKLSTLLKGNQKIFFRINAACHEVEVLEKIGEKLAKNPPLLVVFNPNDQAKGGTSPSLLLKRLSKLGYLVYFLNETSYEYWQYETEKAENWYAFTELSGPCNILCVAPTEKDRLKEIFDDLLISKYAGIVTPTRAALSKQLLKIKLTLRRKINQLARKKHTADLKMTEIVTSDYFKIWQLFSNVTRKLRR